jgi:hypothetical protein
MGDPNVSIASKFKFQMLNMFGQMRNMDERIVKYLKFNGLNMHNMEILS